MGSFAFFIAVAIVAVVVWLEQTFSLRIKKSRHKTRVFRNLSVTAKFKQLRKLLFVCFICYEHRYLKLILKPQIVNSH